MTNQNDEYDDVAAELRALNPPPPMPAESIWAGVEQGLAAERVREREQRIGRRRVTLPLAGAIAASIALLATGALVGYGAAAQPEDAAFEDARVVESIDETRTPTEAIAGDTVQVAWF